jgi:hypothetical protein
MPYTRKEAETMYRESKETQVPAGWHYCSGHNRLERDADYCALALKNGETA